MKRKKKHKIRKEPSQQMVDEHVVIAMTMVGLGFGIFFTAIYYNIDTGNKLQQCYSDITYHANIAKELGQNQTRLTEQLRNSVPRPAGWETEKNVSYVGGCMFCKGEVCAVLKNCTSNIPITIGNESVNYTIST